MSSAATASPSTVSLRPIVGALTIHRVTELKSELLAGLEDLRALALDLGEVDEVDTAGIQLLLAISRETQRRGIAFQLDRPSGAVREALDFLGLASCFAAPGSPAPGSAVPSAPSAPER